MGDAIARESCLRPLRLVDSTRIEGPGQSVWRLHLCYDAGLERIVDGAITTLQEGERLDRLCVTRGEIRMGDRGFAQPGGIKNVLEQGADVLVRLTWNSVKLSGENDKTLDWNKVFTTARAQGSLDMAVQLHKAHDTSFTPVPLRLVLIEKPPSEAAKSRAKARRNSRKSHKTIDPRTLRAADFVILLTSLDDFTVDELAQLYRIRWQIELAFKRLKSIHHIDRLPAKDPKLAKAWLYAHLLFALIVDDHVAQQSVIPPSALSPAPSLDLANHQHRHRGDPRHHRATA
jgi:IS4 transposase